VTIRVFLTLPYASSALEVDPLQTATPCAYSPQDMHMSIQSASSRSQTTLQTVLRRACAFSATTLHALARLSGTLSVGRSNELATKSRLASVQSFAATKRPRST